MATNSDNRTDEGLKALGSNTRYRDDYAPEVLETFVNKHPGNDYWVQFNCPEFTSLPHHRSARLRRDSHILHPPHGP